MRLTINHTTHYQYSQPARYAIQYLRLTPKSDSSQQVLDWRLKAPGRLNQQVDAFGNIMHVMVVDEMHNEMTISVEGEVESHDTNGVLPGTDEHLPPEVFLSPTSLTHADAVVRDFAEGLRAAINADTLDGLHDLSHAVAGSVAYRPESTNVETTAAAALEAGSGVCQDQAHVFTAAARYLGIPTRYVSGYFHARGEGIGEAASHAWSESWIKDLGWVAFDVTNEICASDAHVRLAVGPDYDACAPIRGVRRGGGTEKMDVKVTVAAHGQ
jgi:transglutaminase-like putative cysteine protease